MIPLLSIRQLSKIYHTRKKEIKAVENFSFDINKGEFIVIIGPSGCGKSTILSILAGLEKKSGGEIIYNIENPKLGYMLQSDSLFPWRNIFSNAALGLEINNTLNKESKNYVTKLLNTYSLKDFVKNFSNILSEEMRQRTVLIRTLAINPDIFLLDEPFSVLDYQTRLAISDDVYKIIAKEKKTVVMVTHDIAEAISMADKVIVLSKRPAIIKSIYDIKLTNKSTPINNRKAPEFAKYCELLLKDLDVYA